MAIDDDEELVNSIQVEDVELATYMVAEKGKLKVLSKKIAIMTDSLKHLQSEYVFTQNSMWQKLFQKMPEVHPSNFEGKVDNLNFDPDTYMVQLLKKKSPQP